MLHYYFYSLTFIHSLPNRLWDHLDSNLELYVHPQESYLDEVLKAKPTAGDQSGKNDSLHMDSESERVKPNKESKSRHRREWKGLVRDAAEPPPLRSSEIEKIHLEEKTHQRVSHARRSSSPRPVVQRKRTRPYERENIKVCGLNFVPDYGRIEVYSFYQLKIYPCVRVLCSSKYAHDLENRNSRGREELGEILREESYVENHSKCTGSLITPLQYY